MTDRGCATVHRRCLMNFKAITKINLHHEPARTPFGLKEIVPAMTRIPARADQETSI